MMETDTWTKGRREFNTLWEPIPEHGKIGWTRLRWKRADGELVVVDVMDYIQSDELGMAPVWRPNGDGTGRWFLVHEDDISDSRGH